MIQRSSGHMSAEVVAAHSFGCLQINVLPDKDDGIILMHTHIFRLQVDKHDRARCLAPQLRQSKF